MLAWEMVGGPVTVRWKGFAGKGRDQPLGTDQTRARASPTSSSFVPRISRRRAPSWESSSLPEHCLVMARDTLHFQPSVSPLPPPSRWGHHEAVVRSWYCARRPGGEMEWWVGEGVSVRGMGIANPGVVRPENPVNKNTPSGGAPDGPMGPTRRFRTARTRSESRRSRPVPQCRAWASRRRNWRGMARRWSPGWPGAASGKEREGPEGRMGGGGRFFNWRNMVGS